MPAPTQRERRALPRRCAPRRARAGGRGARGVQNGARNADSPASPARGPRPPRPSRPRALAPGPPDLCAHLPCREGTRRPRSDSAPAWSAAPAPPPPAAPGPAPTHLPRRAAPLRSVSPQRRSHRYPTSIFSRFKGKSDQLFCSRSGSATPSPAAARGLGGLSSPASSRAPLRPSRPSAPPAAARSARLPAPPAADRRAPSPDVTGRSRARHPVLVDVRAPQPSPPRARGHKPRRGPDLWGKRTAPPRPRPRVRGPASALPRSPFPVPLGTCLRGCGKRCLNCLPLPSACLSHFFLSVLSSFLSIPNFLPPILSRLHSQALLPGQCITSNSELVLLPPKPVL